VRRFLFNNAYFHSVSILILPRKDLRLLIPNISRKTLCLWPHISSQFSSISINATTQYDVFATFRGKGIHEDFLSHLIEAFRRKKLKAFVDDELKRGDEIPQSLVRGIEGSLISLMIFSQDYASSCWCLEELVTILQCREKYGQIVIPSFFWGRSCRCKMSNEEL